MKFTSEDHAFGGRGARGAHGFTLLELLVVMGLVATLSFLVVGARGNGGKSAALQSAQAIMANLITAARTNALSTGQSCRLMIHVDASSVGEPRRYLRYIVIQRKTPLDWETLTDAFLPEGVYVVPGNFGVAPAGLFSSSAAIPWLKADGSDLRSTALRANQIVTAKINDVAAELWVGITLSSNAGTVQSGDLILTAGHRRPPGSYATGEAPVELENPGNVRGLTLSSYGVPALINTRTSF